MTNKPNDSQITFEFMIDQFYQKEKRVEKKQVSVYLDTDVIEAFNEFGKDNGKGSRSEVINNFLKEGLILKRGQQVAMPMTAEQIISMIKNMENGERIKCYEYLFNNHLDSKSAGDNDLATKKQIEDTLERDLTEDEELVMKIAYGNGYFRGGKDGMEKVLKR